MSQQEDDLRALAKIMDFLRAVSIILVVMNVYWFCYEAIRLWGVDIGVVDRILMNFDRTAGLFHSILYTKLFVVLLLALSCLGTKGVKGEKVTWRKIWTAIAAGFVLFFLNWWILALPLPVEAVTALYILTIGTGYVCLLMGGLWMSRLLKHNLMDDVFNNENESFMQETRLIESEYSVNLPTRFYYKKRWNNGWINVVNPFRADYSYKGKYLATFTIRRDASSKFGSKNRWGNFPSASLGWRMSDEKFMEPTRKWLDDFKLRAGYGTTGNSNIGSYNYAFQYGTGNYYMYPITGSDSETSPGYVLSNLGDSDAKWETTKMFNIGFDLTALSNRLTAGFDFYVKNTSDLLVPANWSALVGNASKPSINIGDMKNRGVDLSIGWRDKVGEFGYNITANISRYKNEVTRLGSSDLFNDTRLSKVNITTVGQPVGMFYGYQIEGIYQNEQDVISSGVLPYGVATENDLVASAWVGRYKMKDVNNDGKIDADDRTIIGNPHPDLTGGFNISLTWRDFDLSTYMYYSIGNDLYKHYEYYTMFGNLQSNYSKDRLAKSWDPVNNPNGIYPLWTCPNRTGPRWPRTPPSRSSS